MDIKKGNDEDFFKALEGIKNSMKGVKRECPKCQSKNFEFVMQGLYYVKEGDGYFYDKYTYRCVDCQTIFEVDSKPLEYMKDMAKRLKESQNNI